MFWKFLIIMIAADFLCFIIFAFLVTALLAPLALVGRKNSVALITAVAIPQIILAGVVQIYFWGLWAAFCSAMAAKYSVMPEISHHWVYYVVAFLCCTAPITYMESREIAAAENASEASSTRRGTSVYRAIAIAAFVVFSIWPSLYSWPYSWVLTHIV